MRTLIAGLVATAATFAVIGSAGAAAPAPAEILIYGMVPVSGEPDSPGLLYGELFSDKASCEAKRRFKLLVESGSQSKTADAGKTSKDGGIAGLMTAKEIGTADDALFVVAKTDKCAKVKLALDSAGRSVPPARQEPARAKPAKSTLDIVTVSGSASDGAFAGTVSADSRKCIAGRKVRLFGGDTKLDSGTTTKDGAWALHVTKGEYEASTRFKVTVKGTSKCSSGKDSFASET